MMAVAAATLLRRMTSRLRLRHMQALVALDDLRSMSRAAQALDMSQSAMTQLVAELENLLEVRLFLRHSRGVTPTGIAAALLPVARRMLAAAEDGAAIVDVAHRSEVSHVRVASTVAGSGMILHEVLPKFGCAHPTIQVHVDNVQGQELDAAFADRGADIICCRARAIVPDGWEFQTCAEDDVVIVCGPDHLLAGRDAVAMEELSNLPWLQNQVATIAHHHFDEFTKRQGWEAIDETRIVSRSPMLVWSMLRDGRLLSMLPRSAVAPWIEEGLLMVVQTELRVALPPVGYYWRPTAAPLAVRSLARMMRAA